MTALALDTGLLPGRVLVVHAHPDDEVFATAAATIALADRDCQVSLRVGTGGEAGLLAAHQGDSASARATRATQLTRSCKLLGIEDWDYLTEAGQWIDTGHGGPETLAEEDPAVLARAVRSNIDHIRPTIILTVDRTGLTGHPDHIAIHRAVRDALAMPGWKPSLTLGALLLRRQVQTAAALAKTIVIDQQVGSGRVRGRGDNAVEHLIQCLPEQSGRRRAALDEYTPGLGTYTHRELARSLDRFGDSVLLRLALDTSDWHTDRFERIHPNEE
ncbi:PIG-L deacetylase family protein [Actinoplanes sp. NPDC020271]|uniref:PIG-L deacetylase family protein n=1 Tax=Actinoplanes sp. NPDC020271 TaxID=3363896 RepID=UPI0037B933A6